MKYEERPGKRSQNKGQIMFEKEEKEGGEKYIQTHTQMKRANRT